MNNDKNIIYDKYVYFLIGAITVFYLINNYIWLSLNAYPHGPDEFSHLLIAQNFFNGIVSARAEFLVEYFRLSLNSIWPPLFHFTSAVLCCLTGFSSVSPLIINLIYLVILLFSVYSIGYKLYNKQVGILAIMLLSLYPMVFRYSRFFGLDFPQISVLCLSIYFLICTEFFLSKKFSILFGISLGAGLLIKSAFILFLAGPLVCIILQSVFLKGQKSKYLYARGVNLFLSLAVGAFISLSWYLPSYSATLIRLKTFFRTFAHHPSVGQAIDKTSAVFRIDKFFDYLRILVNEQISFLFFIILILALFFFLKKRSYKLFLVCWYVVPCMILSLSFQKEGRFMLSALPAIALISAAGLQELFSYRFSSRLKHPFFILIIFLGLMQFFDVSYNYDRKDKTFPFRTPVGLMHVFCCSATEQHGWELYGPPFKKDWKIDKIAVSIIQDSRDKFKPGPVLVGLIGEDAYVKRVFDFPNVLNYYLVRQAPGQAFAVVNFLPTPRQGDRIFVEDLDSLNYVVFISGVKSWPEFNDFWPALNKFKARAKSLNKLYKDLYGIEKPYDFKDAAGKLSRFLAEKDQRFSLFDKIKLPDGYYAYIYARLGD